jgi:metal iron transporter
MDLAQMNRAYLPKWLNIGLYIMAEAAIVCTDIGQVSSLYRGLGYQS